ncbi:DUF2000 family protein [Bosea sp. SSUT16]|uniref:DUF2000 family protein n=1 Tax=Bosea spartocytisi TaxID=2773451 RepID=A0A927E7A7_9HYPH|nr:DUF2000 family protein [Bosea spartocytisi]MBD3845010.1 DUF2000 family protein [Bosea spartocytisi]MCT4471212.1 DUF2000 family protein [Bosea spartocytisi]
MRYDTKIAIVVRENLATWQKLNVASFLAGGLVGTSSELAGEPYQDGSGRLYGPLIRQPVLIFAATGEELTQVLQRAQGRGVRAHLYTYELFATGNDVDNRKAVAGVATADLDLVGLALHAERKEIDKIVKGLKLHD